MDPSDNHGRAGASSGSHIGRNEDRRSRYQRFIASHGNGRTAVEPEPAEPEDEHAQAGQRQAVTGDSIDLPSLLYLPIRGPKSRHRRGRRRRRPCVRTGAGEIMET